VGTWDRIRAALRREKDDLDQAIDEMKTKANSSLDQKERELNATPAEKLVIEQQRAGDIDAELDAVRQRIEGETPRR
jgi:hypothetical protein